MYDEVVKRLRERSVFLFPHHGESRSYDADLMHEAADAIESLNSIVENNAKAHKTVYENLARRIPLWISVTERLPENQGPFLARYGFGDVSKETGQFFYGVLYYFYADADPHWQHESAGIEVTHWMPLPEPPKEET